MYGFYKDNGVVKYRPLTKDVMKFYEKKRKELEKANKRSHKKYKRMYKRLAKGKDGGLLQEK